MGTSPYLAALVLAFFSNLMSSMTHYSTGPAPVFYGTDYVELGDWWEDWRRYQRPEYCHLAWRRRTVVEGPRPLVNRQG